MTKMAPIALQHDLKRAVVLTGPTFGNPNAIRTAGLPATAKKPSPRVFFLLF